MNIKVKETEDYNIFESNLNKKISEWKANLFFPKRNTLSLSNKKGGVFYLWGTPGSGKTEYLRLWSEGKKIEWISNLDQINDKVSIYIFDAVNESEEFSEEELKNIAEKNKFFLIYSGWNKSNNYYGHNINPSEDIVNNMGWKKLSSATTWGDDFSIREKYLMTSIKKFDEIKKKQFHAIIWKAFENVMTRKERKYFKEIIFNNPIYVKDTADEMFRNLLKKNIIQYNNDKRRYVYSHQNIVNHIFFRKYQEEIKTLSFNKEEFIINVIKEGATQFIKWWIVKKSKKDILLFFLDHNIRISVNEHKLIDKKISSNDVRYKPLSFDCLKILSENKKYQRAYKEFLDENIDITKPLSRTDLFANDLEYFIFSIMSPIRGDDYSSEIINSMKITNFQNRIKWDNTSRRNQMLNFILGRHIQGYIDENFSALDVSQLNNILFNFWDKKNSMSFYEFVEKYWKYINLTFGKEAKACISRLDNVLNAGIGRSSILDASHGYKNFDNRFKCSRNALGSSIFEVGHRSVNLAMYVIFEMPVNKISPFIMQQYNKQQYSVGTFNLKKEITYPFQKFMILLLRRYTLYWKNIPINNETYDFSIETLDEKAEDQIIENKIQEASLIIRKYLQNNNKTLSLTWELDKEKGKNGFNHLWIKNYRRYSMYDEKAPDNSIRYENKTYDPDGLRYVYKNKQDIKVSNTKNFTMYIVSYKLDGKDGEILDKSFLIDLEASDEKVELIEYKDIESWNLSNDDNINESYEKFENDLIPLIKSKINKC